MYYYVNKAMAKTISVDESTILEMKALLDKIESAEQMSVKKDTNPLVVPYLRRAEVRSIRDKINNLAQNCSAKPSCARPSFANGGLCG